MIAATSSGTVDSARQQFATRLQSALTLEEVTSTFMATVGLVLPAASVGMYWLDSDSGDLLQVWSDADGGFLDEYEEYGRTDDPVLRFALRHRRPVDSTRAASAADWQASGAGSALREFGLGHSLEAPLTASGVFLGTINFARPGDSRAFSDADLASARFLGEQLSLATERALRYEQSGRRTTLMEGALDQLPQQAIVTGEDARVLFRNRAARKSKVATATNQLAENDPVAQCIAEALDEFRLQDKRVHTRTVRTSASDHKIVRTYRLGSKNTGSLTLIYDCVDDNRAAPQLPAWDVLSRREQEIAQFVSEGLTTRQIAERAFISENTVKQHLKRVFAKTDVRNRAELVQLIWSSGSRQANP